MKTPKVITLVLAVAAGIAGVVSSASAAQDDLTPVCFRGRTIQVPTYLVNRYIAAGGVPGTCGGTQG